MAEMTLNPEKLPAHVAIIMDGNGRWAKKKGKPRSFGHKAGVEALSTENWKRSAEEVGALMGLLLEYFRRELEELNRKNVRIRILGDIDGMPKGTEKQKAALHQAIEKTQTNTGLILNIAINYGGQQEIVRAAQSLARKVAQGLIRPEEITTEHMEAEMYTAGEPKVDLIIRTSGELRLSNFLLWQCAYAEFYITDTLWPDFDRKQYALALEAYAGRNRRFGGV